MVKIRNNKRKLTLDDWKILVILYKSDDWLTKSITTDELVFKLKQSKRTVEYKLNKLVKDTLLTKIKSYPIFWECVKDIELREEIESEYRRVLKSLLGDIGE